MDYRRSLVLKVELSSEATQVPRFRDGSSNDRFLSDNEDDRYSASCNDVQVERGSRRIGRTRRANVRVSTRANDKWLIIELYSPTNLSQQLSFLRDSSSAQPTSSSSRELIALRKCH